MQTFRRLEDLINSVSKSTAGPFRIAEWFEGRYEIDTLVGRGNSSLVFHATDTRLQREIALKVWNNPSWAADDHFLLREARILAALDHPKIVRVYDHGIHGASGRSWVALEYLGGHTLLDGIHGRIAVPLDWHSIANIASQLIDGVDYLHNSAGVFQLDLKPGNVAASSGSPIIKIMDLGSAEFIGGGNLQRFGTPGYIAPEYFQGSGVTKSADLFSLGVMLFQLCTRSNPWIDIQEETLIANDSEDFSTMALPIDLGHHPERGVERVLSQMRHLDVPKALSEANVPEGLVYITTRLCAFDPRERVAPAEARRILAMEEQIESASSLPSVFISHSHRDKARFVAPLASQLQAMGFTVWLDDWQLRAGEPFWDRIAAAIESSQFVLVVLSEHSLASSAVREEIRSGQIGNLSRVKIVPIRIDAVPFSEIPLMLRSRHILDFVGWEDEVIFQERMRKLAADLVGLASEGTT